MSAAGVTPKVPPRSSLNSLFLGDFLQRSVVFSPAGALTLNDPTFGGALVIARPYASPGDEICGIYPSVGSRLQWRRHRVVARRPTRPMLDNRSFGSGRTISIMAVRSVEAIHVASGEQERGMVM